MGEIWEEPHYSNPASPFVLPLYARTYNLHKKGRLETPIFRDTGLPDKRAFVNLIKGTVIAGYDWTSPTVQVPKLTRHHLLWPHAHHYKSETVRSHARMSINMPVIAHAWGHDITLPLKPLRKEVDHDYSVANGLADNMRMLARHPAFLARETLRIYQEVFVTFDDLELDTLKKEIEEDKSIDLEYELDQFGMLFEVAKGGPKEFQVIDYSSFELNNVTDMLRISNRIGRKAMIDASLGRLLLSQEQEKIAA